jgi:aspartyl-tRNA(Asn)/glutamyl-tRNA(Gln) amidotransferase subunit A
MSEPVLGVADLARRIAAREVSTVEITRRCLERISALDPTLRAFITVAAETALEEARRAEAQVTAGGPLGPLHGVPVGLKDLFETRGLRTTGGSKILADFVPDRDATVVARLRAAGAVVLGKLNMHEFAFGPEGVNDHYGTTRNPWDVRRLAGGSSSGSAVAVAADMVAAALGSDTGGSVRIPAALCGVTGLKPTYGRVSRAGVLPLAWTMDHVGPMARTAEDCARLLTVIAGFDPADPTTSRRPVPDYTGALTGDVRGVRVGLLEGFFVDETDPEVRAAVETAARALESLGAVVDRAKLESARDVAAAAFAIVGSEALAYHAAWLRTRPQDYQADVRERLQMGVVIGGAHYVRAQQWRARLRTEVDRALERFDVLLAPTTPCTAPRLGETEAVIGGRRTDVRSALLRLTRPFNLTGHPACSLPCGLTPDGLPVGMQIVGRAFDEATVLRVADAYQRASDWHRRRPP